jgi:hypothetical protein
MISVYRHSFMARKIDDVQPVERSGPREALLAKEL